MKITLNVFSTLRRVIESKFVELELPRNSTVKKLLSSLQGNYGSGYKNETSRSLYDSLVERYDLFLNKKALLIPQDLDVILKDGDELVILLPSGGG